MSDVQKVVQGPAEGAAAPDPGTGGGRPPRKKLSQLTAFLVSAGGALALAVVVLVILALAAPRLPAATPWVVAVFVIAFAVTYAITGPNSFRRLATYTAVRVVALLLTVVVAAYLTIIIANMGGKVDEIRRSQIKEQVGLMFQNPDIRRLPKEERDALFEAEVRVAEDIQGLNRPFLVRSVDFLRNAMTLNLGQALTMYSDSHSREVRNIILERLPATLVLTATTQFIIFFTALFTALALSRHYGSFFDRMVIALAPTSAAPGWFYGIFLLLFFAALLRILPFGGMVADPPPPTLAVRVMQLAERGFAPQSHLFNAEPAFASGLDTQRVSLELRGIFAQQGYTLTQELEFVRDKGAPGQEWWIKDNGISLIPQYLVRIEAQSLKVYWVSPSLLDSYEVSVARHLVLPILAILLSQSAVTIFSWRTFFLVYSSEDYVEMAKAKGLTSRMIERRYILRPTLPPIITSFALMLIYVWSGMIILETVFNWPGIGQLYYQAITKTETAMIVGITVINSYLLAVTVFALDFIYALVDPRVKLGGGTRQ